MEKAIFLDRDGTINIEKNYLYRKGDFIFLPGAIEGMKLLQNMGFRLVIITNQSGIARGYYTEEQYQNLNNWMEDQLKAEGVVISLSLFCPHHPDAVIKKYRVKCNCRNKVTHFVKTVFY